MAQNFSGGAGRTGGGGTGVQKDYTANYSAGGLVGGAGREGGGGTGVQKNYTTNFSSNQANYSPLSNSSRDGGFASIGNAAAQAVANAQVNALTAQRGDALSTNFGVGNLLGGYGLSSNRQPVRPIGLLPDYNPTYGPSEFQRFYKGEFAPTYDERQLMNKEIVDNATWLRDENDPRSYTFGDLLEVKNSPELQALAKTLFEPIRRYAYDFETRTQPGNYGTPLSDVEDLVPEKAKKTAQPAPASPEATTNNGLNIPGGYRGVIGPNGELRIQPTSYGTNYQTAQALRAAYPEQFGKYSTTDVADTLEKFSQAVPGEAGAREFGIDSMNNIARVGLNQIIGGYSPLKMLRGMDTTGMRPATKGFEQPGTNSAGMTRNWYNQASGNAYRNLAANAIREAMFGQGVSPEAMNASNFVAAGTPMVRGVNTVGSPIQGTQFGSDPNWGTRIADRNQVALGLLGGDVSGTYAGIPEVTVPSQSVPAPEPQVQSAGAPASTGQVTGGDWTQAMRYPPAPIETPIQDAIGGLLGSYYGVGYDGYPNRQSVRQGWDVIPSEPTPYSPAPEDASLMEKFANVFKPGNLFPYAKDVNPIEGTPEGQYIQQTEFGPLKGYMNVPYRYEPMDKPVYGAPGVPDGWTAPVPGASVITFKDGGGIWKHPSQGWQPISQFRGDLGDMYKGEGGKQAQKEAKAAAKLNADESATSSSTEGTDSSMLPQWYLDWLQSTGQYGGLLG